MAVPVAVPVKVTAQLPADRVQLERLNEPPVVPADNVKVTVPPVGVLAGVVVSVTVALQVEPWLMTTVPGLQATPVAVSSMGTGVVAMSDVTGGLPV